MTKMKKATYIMGAMIAAIMTAATFSACITAVSP